MKRLALPLIAAVALAGAAAQASAAVDSGASAAAASLPPGAFTSGPVRDDARQLVRLMMPEDLYLASIERAVADGLDRADGDLDPRIMEAMRARLPAIAATHERERLAGTYDRYARAVGASFTPDDVVQLLEFYRSKTGQKVVAGKFAGMDLSFLTQKWTEDPDAGITAGDIMTLNRSATEKFVAYLDEADKEALLGFTRIPVFPKVAAFAPVMAALEAQIASEPDPEFDQKLERVMSEILGSVGAADSTS